LLAYEGPIMKITKQCERTLCPFAISSGSI
jgi:hypothetical protein